MTVSRREFLGATAVLPRVLPFVGPTEPSASAQRRTRRVDDFAFLSASDVVQAIRRGEISALELTELMFKRIDAINPRINAIVTLMREEALARAREVDDERAKGRYLGPLHGIPVTIKDAFEVKGVRTTAGNPAFKDHIPTGDSTVVERLRRAGAILLGMTNVPFMLSDWQSYNAIFGQSNNPWDLTRTPGGSTGGGAAALAAGLGYLAAGSDIAGSIRVPAHFCGVYGHKPTLNLLPNRGHIPPPPGVVGPPSYLPVVGPLARSATDLKLVMEVLGGPDGDEAVAYSWKSPPPRKQLVRDYRIGYVLDDKLCPVSSDVGTVLTDAVSALRKAGANLSEGWPQGLNAEQEFRNYRFLLNSVTGPSGPYTDFIAARSRQIQARGVWQDYFRTRDAFLLPAAIIPAFPHDHRQPITARVFETRDGTRQYEDLMFWISFATHTGHPATVAPVGLTSDGLPVGIQIIGPYLEDATPIDIAAKFEQLVGGFRAPKGL